MKHDVVALGELLIDFGASGLSLQGNPIFEANPGGAPCNLLAMLAKQGKSTAFIGKVGQDMFGRQLKAVAEAAGIGTSGLVMDDTVNTTLAFVQNAPDGEREFSFFRGPGADTCLLQEEVNAKLIESCSIFHFGSLSLTHQPARQATQYAVETAQKADALISFDPNMRPLLWDSLDCAKEQMLWGCGKCHILKVAEEELAFLSGCTGILDGVSWMRENFGQIRIIFVTRGKAGAECFYQGHRVQAPTYLQVKPVDTTGAGDTFLGACLNHLLDHELDSLDEASIKRMLQFANAAASLVTTKKGAILAMPSREEVMELVESN